MKNNDKTDLTVQDKMFKEMEEKSIFDQAKDFSYEYANDLSQRKVYPSTEAISNLEVFEEELPDFSSPPDLIIDQLHKFGSPATVAQTGGRYYGLVTGATIPVTLAAKWLADFWGQNTPLYVSSPIISKLEQVVQKWLNQLFGLPDQTVSGFVSGTSMAILCGLASARFRILKNLDWDVNEKGLFNAPKIKIVASQQIHGTVIKAAAILGIGKDNIKWIAVDDQGRVNSKLLPELDNKTILILQAGNVNSGSFDDFDKICTVANKAKAWIHIDGAFGLWAAGSKDLKYLTHGINKANSWSVDAHKTLNTPYDCGIVLCKDEDALVSALQATGSYIIYGKKRDGMLYTPEMSRRARIVELWAALKYLGKTGIEELVNGLHQRAVQISEELKKHGFKIWNDVVFNQVLVSCENDEMTDKTMKFIQNSGECWCGGALWKNKRVIRISICSWATTPCDILRSVRAFVRARKMAEQTVKKT